MSRNPLSLLFYFHAPTSLFRSPSPAAQGTSPVTVFESPGIVSLLAAFNVPSGVASLRPGKPAATLERVHAALARAGGVAAAGPGPATTTTAVAFSRAPPSGSVLEGERPGGLLRLEVVLEMDEDAQCLTAVVCASVPGAS